jgi:hypothetical protein
LCPILQAAQKFPNFIGYYKFFDLTFPGLLHPCPYKNIMVFNASLPRVEENSMKNYVNVPNGFTQGEIFYLLIIE